MASPIGIYQFQIDAYLSDFRAKATLPMIGGFMLQAATKHAEERGFGYSAMTNRKRVWVLSRMAIEIMEYPTNEQLMSIKTWVHDVNRITTERCFSFEDAEGKEIGFARSIWAAIDLDTRKPTNVLEMDGLVDYINKDKSCPIEKTTKIASLDEASLVDSFNVKYSDIDINKHLNSMKYIEYLIDLFPLEVYATQEIQRFEINYIQEGQYGAKIDLLKQEISNSVYILEMRDAEKTICSSKLIWRNI